MCARCISAFRYYFTLLKQFMLGQEGRISAKKHFSLSAQFALVLHIIHPSHSRRTTPPQLNEQYAALRAAGKRFLLVYISDDNDKDDFDEFRQGMEFPAMPYASPIAASAAATPDKDTVSMPDKDTVSDSDKDSASGSGDETPQTQQKTLELRFVVEETPTVVLLNARTGEAITADAAHELQRDAFVSGFPYGGAVARRVGVRWFSKLTGCDICFDCVDEAGNVLREAIPEGEDDDDDDEEEEEVRSRRYF